MLRKEVAQPVTGGGETPSSSPIDTLLANRHQFLRFLERRLPSPALAEDLLQSAYLRALEHSATIRQDESATAWFYHILRNAVIDHYRHRNVEDRTLETWADDLQTETPADDLTRDIVCQCIARVLPSLNPTYAQALTEIDLNEGTLAAYATRESITLPTATVRLHRARRALKHRLTETCGTCAIHACLNCTCRPS